jgi:hypothetical protein
MKETAAPKQFLRFKKLGGVAGHGISIIGDAEDAANQEDQDSSIRQAD